MPIYFLYARKSTDVEDKQVRSIEDQLAVLRALAKQEGFTIAEEFIEKQSAKMPGRPIFGEMLARIGKGQAQGIICWKLDRLARNPVDGGQIMWMLQKGVIQHIRSNERSYRPTDNVLMMAVELGMATQYVLDLSSNTKRGLHEKAKRGEFPGVAPIGYLNDLRSKTIVIDKQTAPIIKEAFVRYAKNRSNLEDISTFFFDRGVVSKKIQRYDSKGGNPMRRDRADYILSNPFYCGLFRFCGELYEGKHQPIVSKKLFDEVQKILEMRSNRKTGVVSPKPLCGLLSCGECGRMITAEIRTKRQKNGNVHEYTYYHCTKKNVKCSQPHVRGEELDKQLSTLLKTFVMPPEWARELSAMADKDEHEAVGTTAAFVQDLRSKISEIDRKQERLFDGYVSELIEPERYREQKNKLTSEKKTLAEQIDRLEQKQNIWLEPLRNWIKDAETLNEINETTPLPLKKSFAQKIFGSNLFLKNQKIEYVPQTQYAALSAAYGKINNFPFSFIVVDHSRPCPNSLRVWFTAPR